MCVCVCVCVCVVYHPVHGSPPPPPAAAAAADPETLPFNRDQVSAFLHQRRLELSLPCPGIVAKHGWTLTHPRPPPLTPPGWVKAASEVDFVGHVVYLDLGSSWDAPLAPVEWREERAAWSTLPLGTGSSLLVQFGSGRVPV